MERRVASRSESLARRFDRVLEVLQGWGYVSEWELTDAGQRLGRLFHESDLLVMEALRRGLLDGLDPATFAAMVSVFTYEHRSSDPPPPPWFPSAMARKRWLAIASLGAELNGIEDEARLTLTRSPDPTFAAVAFAWAAGEGFADVVADEDLSGGDFVRNVKQLIDLIRQLGEIAPDPATQRVARQAGELLFRGVVAASSAVGAPV
jgi:ATP-dependent RNA helicase HelY